MRGLVLSEREWQLLRRVFARADLSEREQQTGRNLMDLIGNALTLEEIAEFRDAIDYEMGVAA